MSSTVLNKKVTPKRILKPDCDKTKCNNRFLYFQNHGMLRTNNGFASFNQQNIIFFSFKFVFLTGINDAPIKI